MQATSTTRRKAVVIGGGIAGPVVAMFFKRAGIDATVFEARSTPSDFDGLFLNAAANGLDVLRTLGLDKEVIADGFPMSRMIMWSGRGKRLGEMINGTDTHHGTIVKRGLLQKAIREEATRQGIKVEFGKRLKDVKVTDDQKVIAYFEDGSEAHGDFLVGCDGIQSRTREIIFPEAPSPTYTGLLSCGGYSHSTALPATPGVQHMIFGKRAFFGYLVKPSGDVWWFCNVDYPGEPTRQRVAAIPNEDWKKRILELFSEDQSLISQIISETKGEIGVHPVYDIPTLPTWHKGPMVLVGDAVHATSPHVGQGASMALEDAIVLAKCLREIPDLEQAFAKYESLRKERVEKLVAYARRTGRTKVASSPMAVWFRDLMMPLFLKLFANSKAHAWIHSYRINWEEKLV